MDNHPTGTAPNYTSACIVMFGVNITWVLVAIWAIWGLIAAMLLAHEATHVWQWQNRKVTGFSPLKAASEHGFQRDPYLFEIDGNPAFLDFGYEQQGSIVEEYVCCRALAPQAPRTKRLHDLIGQVMPVSALPQSRQHDVRMPWDGVTLDGICG